MKTNQCAMTIVELLTTLSVLTIILSLGMPALAKQLQANRDRALHDQLKSSLQAARTYSIEQRRKIEVCGSGNGNDCDNDWRHGWLIREKSSGQILHTTHLATPTPLAWKGLSKRIGYHPDGHSHASNGTFSYCSVESWRIVLNRQGRARSVHSNIACP